MFLGHYAVGLATKTLTPYTSLGTLVVAAQLVDLIWPTFLMLGIERVRIDPGNTAVTPLAFEHYPWTHSLVMSGVWAALFAALYAFFRRYPRGTWAAAGAVVSHWLLDFITHRPDLPLAPGLDRVVGLGLWNSVRLTAGLELAMFLAGAWLYARSTEPTDRVGTYALAGFAVVLPLIYAASLFGPPPPSERAVAIAGQAQWLLVAWAMWIDRHRVAVRQWQ
jgi:membrane-bound metal-dependent hydrolase YbcI (DUF457 family)